MGGSRNVYLNYGLGRWGKEIIPYIEPKPPVGIHRYILVLFEQKGPIGMVEQPTSRVSFKTPYFSNQLNLSLHMATIYFNSQKEPQAKRH
ncbi:phosphatidylethanolamine-binding protein [Medicago truncatula]|uniref:Phosphatidylethanolamine-binding protein n=1 Tax=Medicago truncatula TaxID=3880 RepID=G7K1Q2_MEDTR|nr:phosphatidylethanolamine-binding protein [Medicago truncatula]